MKELKYEDALTFLEKAVADKGAEFVYQIPQYLEDEDNSMCVYFSHETVEGEVYTQPSCIVGHVLDYMGLRDEFVDDWEGSGIKQVIPNLGLQIDTRTTVLLEEVQGLQDAGHTWGNALFIAQARADEAVRSRPAGSQ